MTVVQPLRFDDSSTRVTGSGGQIDETVWVTCQEYLGSVT